MLLIVSDYILYKAVKVSFSISAIKKVSNRISLQHVFPEPMNKSKYNPIRHQSSFKKIDFTLTRSLQSP